MAAGAQPASWTYEAEVPVLELASEEKAFPARKESFDELGMAKDWFYLVGEGAGTRRATAIPCLRKTHTAPRERQALFWYRRGKVKERVVQDKALRLAQAYEKKGEITQARNFYSLAVADAKGGELEERTEAQHQKSEEKRQKQFTKDQDKLEKEPGCRTDTAARGTMMARTEVCERCVAGYAAGAGQERTA